MIRVHNAYCGKQDFYSTEEAAAFLAIAKRKSLYSDTHPHLLAHYLYQDWRKGAGRAYEAKALETARLEAAQELAAIKAEVAAMQRDYAARRMKAAASTTALVRKYDPSQPRVPGGNENGGQWTKPGGELGDPTLLFGLDGLPILNIDGNAIMFPSLFPPDFFINAGEAIGNAMQSDNALDLAGGAQVALEQFQRKWEPVSRPKLRKNKELERIR